MVISDDDGNNDGDNVDDFYHHIFISYFQLHLQSDFGYMSP